MVQITTFSAITAQIHQILPYKPCLFQASQVPVQQILSREGSHALCWFQVTQRQLFTITALGTAAFPATCLDFQAVTLHFHSLVKQHVHCPPTINLLCPDSYKTSNLYSQNLLPAGTNDLNYNKMKRVASPTTDLVLHLSSELPIFHREMTYTLKSITEFRGQMRVRIRSWQFTTTTNYIQSTCKLFTAADYLCAQNQVLLKTSIHFIVYYN